jgi:AraC family transcriptional regulator, arabinose operon regulatory protein
MSFPEILDESLPFKLRSVGLDHLQEPIRRPLGYPHWHWIEVRSGLCALESPSGSWRLQAGDGIFLRPDEAHSYHASAGALTVDWITFDGSGVPSLLASGPLSASGPYRLAERGPGRPAALEAIAILAANSGDERRAERSLSALVYRLILELSDAVSAPGRESKRAEFARLEPALALARSRFREDISMPELAGTLGVSTSQLCRLFVRYLGVSPKDYVTGLRMSRARRLLTERSELRVSEIAREVGYEDANYFSRLFKQREGMGPERFRALHGARRQAQAAD